MTLELSHVDQRMLDGDEGAAAQLAMRFLVRAGEVTGALRLIDVSRAHVIGGFYIGRVGVDLVRRLVELGGYVRIPTTLTASAVALSQPELASGDPHAAVSYELANLYERLGAEPVWTCAPYTLPDRPGFGEQLAWGESGAVAFANSVLGARTNKYGTPLDIAAAICGRVPEAGLHLTSERAAQVVIELDIDQRLLSDDVLYPVLGYAIGAAAGAAVPAVMALPSSIAEHQLAAMLAAATTGSGGVELLHAVGITPEAPTIEAALHGRDPEQVISIGLDDLRRVREALCTARPNEPLGTVCVGAPHLSLPELEHLADLIAGRTIATSVAFYASTCRFVADAARRRGRLQELEAAGVRLVLDACTYYGRIVDPGRGTAMTCSAKWAHFAPGLLGARVFYGSMSECVESAITGAIQTDDTLWAVTP